MKLLIVRHGKAEDRDDWQAKKLPDGERPLTFEGIEEFTHVAEALPGLVSTMDRIYTSPFRRALQTAEILSKTYPNSKLITTETLLQGTPWKDVQTFLLKLEWSKDGVVSIVGHENHLSIILSNLISCTDENLVRFKKGGSALVDLELRETKVIGKLLWFLPPKVILKLAK